MKVNELIEQLSKYPKDLEVVLPKNSFATEPNFVLTHVNGELLIVSMEDYKLRRTYEIHYNLLNGYNSIFTGVK